MCGKLTNHHILLSGEHQVLEGFQAHDIVPKISDRRELENDHAAIPEEPIFLDSRRFCH